MRVVAIVQARMGSTRLPGKVLMDLGGRPMVVRVLERAARIAGIDEVVLATTTLPGDDALETVCDGWQVVRGDADDVLARYRLAAERSRADVIVRLTADCPLLSPVVSSLVTGAFLCDTHGADYVSNTLVRSFPRGLDTEVFTRAALDASAAEAIDPVEREHVTPFIYRRQHRFRCLPVSAHPNRAELRWTVDEVDDLRLVREMYEAFPGEAAFDYHHVIALLERRPELSAINRHIEQKKA